MQADKLHVIAVISNPVRYRSRYELFHRFEKMVTDSGAHLWVVEAAFGARPHAVTSPGEAKHIQLRTQDELWHKENMVNVGISRLPSDWEYVAWIDADVRFARPDWAEETVHQLQHYEVVQMWSEAHDLTPDFSVYRTHVGFVYCMLNGLPRQSYQGQKASPSSSGPYGYGAKGGSSTQKNLWHPGYAWAATRKAMDTTGCLLDTAILGAGDQHMAHALFGEADQTVKKPGLHPGYRRAVMNWQERASYLNRDVGYVAGALFHDFHGAKRNRRYAERWQILVDGGFNPETDLTRDAQGLWHLRPERIRLRDQIRAYFRSRDEDSTEVD